MPQTKGLNTEICKTRSTLPGFGECREPVKAPAHLCQGAHLSQSQQQDGFDTLTAHPLTLMVPHNTKPAPHSPPEPEPGLFSCPAHHQGEAPIGQTQENADRNIGVRIKRKG